VRRCNTETGVSFLGDLPVCWLLFWDPELDNVVMGECFYLIGLLRMVRDVIITAK
jgi:hypothetical protein